MNRDALAIGVIIAGLAASAVATLVALALIARLVLWLTTFEAGQFALIVGVACLSMLALAEVRK